VEKVGEARRTLPTDPIPRQTSQSWATQFRRHQRQLKYGLFSGVGSVTTALLQARTSLALCAPAVHGRKDKRRP